MWPGIAALTDGLRACGSSFRRFRKVCPESAFSCCGWWLEQPPRTELDLHMGWSHMAGHEASLGGSLLALIFALGALSVLAGLLTPIGGVTIVLAAAVACGGKRRIAGFLDAPIPLEFLAAIAIAICLLGPGWFSVDGIIFGRREIIIPGLGRRD